VTQGKQEQFNLPVMQILREAYGFVFSVPQRVIIAAIVPFGLYFVLSTIIQLQFLNPAAVDFFQLAVAFEDIDPNAEIEDLSVFTAFFGAMFAFFGWAAILAVLAGIAGASMAAAWHRTTLIGLDAPRTGFGFFFGRSELNYFFRALLMVLITVAALFAYSIIASILFGIIAAAMALGAPAGGGVDVMVIALMVIMGVGGFLLWLYLWSKLIMCLPASALGIQSFGFGQAWSATNGHVGRLMLTYAGLLLPLSIVGVVVSWGLDQAFGMGGDPNAPTVAEMNRTLLVSVVPTFLITAFSTALIASGMSYTYYRLGQPPEWVEKVF